MNVDDDETSSCDEPSSASSIGGASSGGVLLRFFLAVTAGLVFVWSLNRLIQLSRKQTKTEPKDKVPDDRRDSPPPLLLPHQQQSSLTPPRRALLNKKEDETTSLLLHSVPIVQCQIYDTQMFDTEAIPVVGQNNNNGRQQRDENTNKTFWAMSSSSSPPRDEDDDDEEEEPRAWTTSWDYTVFVEEEKEKDEHVPYHSICFASLLILFCLLYDSKWFSPNNC